MLKLLVHPEGVQNLIININRQEPTIRKRYKIEEKLKE